MPSKKTISRKLAYVFLAACGVVSVAAVSAFFLLQNSAAFHWNGVSEFRSRPRSYGCLPYTNIQILDAGQLLRWHLDRLVALDELLLVQKSFKSRIPFSELHGVLKKNKAVIWLQITPPDETPPKTGRQYSLRAWILPDSQDTLEDILSNCALDDDLNGRELPGRNESPATRLSSSNGIQSNQ